MPNPVSRYSAQGHSEAGLKTAPPPSFPGSRERFLIDADNHLDVALQPIVDTSTGCLFGCESLVRNLAPLGLAHPQELFDLAHSYDVLAEVEGRLLDKALTKLRCRRDIDHVLLFVNIDGRSLVQPERIISALASALAKHGRVPDDICIELSETNQSLCSPQFAECLNELRSRGFHLAMDDFGIGYSGLQMLYKSSPDFIKIDRFFVAQLHTDNKKRVFVQSLTSMAHLLGIKVIAEGVETAAEHHLARDMRCDLIQGYFSGRPTQDVQSIPLSCATVSLNRDKRNDVEVIGLGTFAARYKAIRSDLDLAEVFPLVEANPLQEVFPVTDKRGHPIGIIKETDLKPIIYSVFGRELLKNANFKRSVAELIRPTAVLDANTSVAQLLEFESLQFSDGLLLIEKQKYLGYLAPAELLKLTMSHQIGEIRKQNPMTKLPGNEAIRDHLTRAAEAGADRLVAYFDLDNFKPFNDKYGFRRGDRAILMLANILKAEFQSEGVFVGHVGGDDFVVVAHGSACERVENQVPSVRSRISFEIASLYDAEDRERGGIEGARRDGAMACFPLMSCSIGMVHLPAHARAESGEQVSQELARAKRLAKSDASGIHLTWLSTAEPGEFASEEKAA